MNFTTPELWEFLSKEECSKVVNLIFRLDSHWLQRADSCDFYTLGAATYLDFTTAADYQNKKDIYNPILIKEFDFLFDRLVCRLEEITKESFYYDCNLALPGFHIFGPKLNCNSQPFNSTLFTQGGRVHQDTTHISHIDYWSSVDPNFSSNTNYSLTLSLSLPSEPSGLDLWWPSDTESTFFQYIVGRMLIFDSSLTHRISPVAQYISNDTHRITLQAHMSKVNNKWVIYF